MIIQAELQMGLDALAGEIAPGGGRIVDLKRLSGGASQETWSFALDGQGGRERLILRRAPKGAKQHENNPGLENEAVLMQLAGAAGVPSPRVRLVLNPGHGLGAGFIMDHVDGETIGRKILRDAPFAAVRPKLARRCGELMARIHTIAVDKAPGLRLADGAIRLADIEARYEASGTRRPVFELAIQWLRANLPAPGEPKVVHGDFRNGNIIVGPNDIEAVLDWEIAHLGDPMEDLGWICVTPWRFGEIDNPVGGFGSRQDLIAGYEAQSGQKVDPAAVRFWETLGSLSWGVSCGAIAVDDLAARDRPLERSMIGRRASENEIDLLRLLTEEA